MRKSNLFKSYKSGRLVSFWMRTIGEMSKRLFERLKWLPLKDEISVQKCTLIFWRYIRDH